MTDPGKRGWLDQRLDLVGMRRALLDREVPDRLTWWHTLGSAALTVLVVQIVTGVVLATFYAPAPDHAYESIRYLQHNVTMGGLLRAVHHWGLKSFKDKMSEAEMHAVSQYIRTLAKPT